MPAAAAAARALTGVAFFGHIGWDPDDFVGFRCEVRYPVWRAGYCMGSEYLGAPGPKTKEG